MLAERWQILSPVRNHEFGTTEINRKIQAKYRGGMLNYSKGRGGVKPFGEQEIVYSDKVMQPPIDPKAKAPLCLEGGRACPPEDCGGPPGYCDYLAAVADPQHEQHEELLEWRGPFDPEGFDAKKVTREIRKVK